MTVGEAGFRGQLFQTSVERRSDARGRHHCGEDDEELIGRLIDHLIAADALHVVFQPIRWLRDGRLYGYEVLGRVRPKALRSFGRLVGRDLGGSLPPSGLGPAELLALAAQVKRLLAVDLAWRKRALLEIARQDPGGEARIFLNVDTRGFAEPGHRPGDTRRLIERHGLLPERFVLELTESGRLLDSPALEVELVAALAGGLGLAIDDLGSGYASLKALITLRPGHVKLDRSLIRGAADDPLHAHLIGAVAQCCRAAEIAVIAEGLESEAEVAAVVRAGVPLGQGHLVGRPIPRLDPAPLTARRRQALRRVARSFWFD
jgi:EAL domain-containing protein (putative c-di-GMP-specific phosphodiesterase class I)